MRGNYKQVRTGSSVVSPMSEREKGGTEGGEKERERERERKDRGRWRGGGGGERKRRCNRMCVCVCVVRGSVSVNSSPSGETPCLN